MEFVCAENPRKPWKTHVYAWTKREKRFHGKVLHTKMRCDGLRLT